MKTRTKKIAPVTEPAKKEERPDLSIRAATVELTRAEGDKAPSVKMSISSEEPVLSYIRIGDQWIKAYEVLDHSEGSIDMSRAKDGLVILDRHYGDQIGLMAVKIEGKKLGGTVEFCTGTRAQEISADAARGLRRNVSVGYVVDSASYRIEGDREGIPVARAMSWTPYEASFEPVPADTTVGVNRAAEPVAIATKKENVMDPKLMEEIAALRKMLEANAKTEAEIKELRAKIAELEAKKPAPEARTVAPIGGSDGAEAKVLKRYSLMNVVRVLGGMSGDIGFEREISEECAKLRNKPAVGLIVPFGALAKRDFTVAGTSSNSVATNLYSGEFIDLLRTKYILGQLGCQFLTGLVGDVAIPKMTAGTTGYWVTEGANVTGSQPSLGQVTGTPHTAGALVNISRKLMIQSTPDAEAMVQNEIVERILRTVQVAVFAGAGGAEPNAITNASGINNPSVTTGTPTYEEILNFPGSISADSAEADGQKFAMTAEVWAKLAATKIDAGSGRLVLDPFAKNCIGYPYLKSEDLPANSLWFGNWASVVIGVWGNGVDLAATDASLFASGGMTLRALQDVDVMVRLGQALAYNTAVTS
jgi:HK97 family phage major capsid protein